jgi:hypothetical protein
MQTLFSIIGQDTEVSIAVSKTGIPLVTQQSLKAVTLNRDGMQILKGSDDGISHSEILGFWTLSIAQKPSISESDGVAKTQPASYTLLMGKGKR